MGRQGRGDGRIFRPSKTPSVTIGLTPNTSSRTLDSQSTEPFYLIVTARILTTPHPSSPITLATHLNPFSPLPNKSFTDIICLNPSSSTEKRIKTYQVNWPHYVFEASDKKDDWDFITIPASDPTTDPSQPGTREFIIRHEVPRDLITAAEVKKGETYRVAFTNKCLGTTWWMFGDLQDEGIKDVRFVSRGERQGVPVERKGMDEEGRWYSGEIPAELALVVEGEDEGAVEFEIV